MVPNNLKIVVFMLFLSIWAAPIGPKKVDKGPQVNGMYGPMSKLNYELLTKSFGPFF
jgi:hypothetical protein